MQPPTRGVRRPRAAAARLAAATLAVVALAGCGVGLPREVGPRGVDGLVVPTPSPDPADFVGRVDNPWLPLEPGSSWRYEVTVADRPAGTVVVTVAEGTHEVAGVATTVVREVTRDRRGDVQERVHRWFAQDSAGNVWAFGERAVTGRSAARVSWVAGADGARAALAMPARPRVGDGYELQAVPGVAEAQGRVLDLTASRATPYAAWDDLLHVERTTPLDPAERVDIFHARGIGPVVRDDAGAGELEQLVAYEPGV